MRFTYKATTSDGKTITGSVEAADRQAVLALLRKQNVRPLTISTDKEGKLKGGFDLKKSILGTPQKVKLAELVIFTRQLSTMISAGVPLARSLQALQNDAENPYFREVLAGITKDVEAGSGLGDSFAKYPRVFSDVYVNMTRAGEEGGILDEILKRLATQVEQDASMRKKIKGAMMYPLVLSVLTVVAFFGIMLFVMPKFSTIIASLAGPNAKLPAYSQAMLNFSRACTNSNLVKWIPVNGLNKIPNMVVIGIIIGIIIWRLHIYTRTEKGKLWWHKLVLRIPIAKTIILKVVVSRFSRTFASLMGAGVNVLDALDITGRALGNKVIELELKSAAVEVQAGKALSEPMGKSKYFPSIVAQMLMVGEETGNMDAVLGKIAEFYDEEVTVTIDSLSSIIEPVMIVILGSAVGLIAASVMGPIANLSRQIGNS